ncbi:MAG: UDP-4-amino-4,6-dideoxy-N-acetyl-beta-L-altrosamine N-acetyltransferase [Gammaproteobacteria bacterium]|nr:UDP-4-amino-4,6-dideoxy-N-acetyl-beta-L-altrosamine N-acetyltransferase [Gammaproteobacteria bacterium]
MLREIQREDLEIILQWRNHPNVRKAMFTDHEITLEEHLAWWNRVKDDNTKLNLILEYEDKPVGVLNFYDMKDGECVWGFYLDNWTERNRQSLFKIWDAMEREALDYAFNISGCKRLLGETFEFNSAVLQMHYRYGFKKHDEYMRMKDGIMQNVIITELKSEDFYKK